MGLFLVAFSIILRMTWLSLRFCSSGTLLMKSCTLAEVSLVLISANFPMGEVLIEKVIKANLKQFQIYGNKDS